MVFRVIGVREFISDVVLLIKAMFHLQIKDDRRFESNSTRNYLMFLCWGKSDLSRILRRIILCSYVGVKVVISGLLHYCYYTSTTIFANTNKTTEMAV